MAVPEDRRTVPISLLPIDAIVALRSSSSIDVRRAKDSTPGGKFAWAGAMAAGLLTLAALEGVAVSDAPPFAYALRFVPLVAGAALVAAWLAWRRAPGFRPARGDGMLVSKASLVLVGEDTVEVLPAEKIAVNENGIVFQGATIDEGFHDKAWLADLDRAIRAAKEDPSAREGDRYRQAAARATEGAAAGWVRARRAPIAIAAGLGLAAATFVEAGVLGPMGSHTRAALMEQLEVARGAERDLGEHVADRAERVARASQIAADEAARAAKQRHDDAYAKALGGTVQDAHDFIAQYGKANPGERAKALERYMALARPAIASTQASDDLRGWIEDCRFVGCAAELTDRARVRFAKAASREIDAAKSSDDVRKFLDDTARYDLDPSFDDKARGRFYALATKEALAGTLKEVRAFLEDPLLIDAPDRARVAARLSNACESAYPAKSGKLLFHMTILRRLCMADTKVLSYAIDPLTDADLGEKAANSLAKDLTEVAALFLNPLEVTAVKSGARTPMVRVAIVKSGVPKPDPDAPLTTTQQPCTMSFRLVDTTNVADEGKTYADEAVCTQTRTFSYGSYGSYGSY